MNNSFDDICSRLKVQSSWFRRSRCFQQVSPESCRAERQVFTLANSRTENARQPVRKYFFNGNARSLNSEGSFIINHQYLWYYNANINIPFSMGKPVAARVEIIRPIKLFVRGKAALIPPFDRSTTRHNVSNALCSMHFTNLFLTIFLDVWIFCSYFALSYFNATLRYFCALCFFWGYAEIFCIEV